ncbi:MAG: GyrI-like domain-containing protein [Anaerolineales bacterium]|nr:GyrI-like domain-containing protein [Anaerolineales bacterium]
MFKIGDFSKLAQVSVKTLRHYGKLGLLRPSWIDRFTGYRYYTADQLPRLNRILALKDLGFSLEQIQHLLREDLPAAELRGMMRMKQGDLERQIQAEQSRLERVEERLRQIEQEGALPSYEVVLKSVPAQAVIGVRQVLPGFRHIQQLIAELRASLRASSLNADAAPYLAIYYDAEYRDQGLDVEAAAPLTRPVTVTQGALAHDLPAVESMACAIHQGPYERLPEAYSALMTWVETHGYRMAGPNRDVYLQGPEAGAAAQVTEVQFPVQKKPNQLFILQQGESGIRKEMIEMEPKIVSKPAFTAVGLLYHGKNENNEIAQMWGQFNPRMGEIKNVVDGAFGVCGSTQEDGSFKYLAGMAVSSVEDLPTGMEVWEVPAQQYAVFPCMLGNIHETYKYAFETWLPTSGYTYTKGPDYEYYDETFDMEKGGPLYIYVPIQ